MTIAFVISMFTLGLVTSLHCVSMCGPMVVSCSIGDESSGGRLRALPPQLAYQGAKLVSYMTFGLLVGVLGSLFNLDSIRPWAMLLAGSYMVVLGLGLTGKVKWAQRFQPRTPKFLMGWIRAIRSRGKAACEVEESSYDRYVAPTLLGLVTGLMPCGALIGAYVLAAASGSPVGGAVGMLAFGLGTAPLMLVLGTATGLMTVQMRHRVMSVLAIVVIGFGAVYINRGLTLAGSPVSFNTVRTAVLGGPNTSDGQAAVAAGADGVAEVPLVIENTRFVPQQLQVPADRPVRLIVDRREANACSDQIAIPQLGVLQNLTPNGQTVVELPASKAGSYTLTCGMGMMSGSLAVGAGGVAGSGGLPAWVWLLFAAGSAIVALWLARSSGVARTAPATGKAAAASAGTPRETSGSERSGKGSATECGASASRGAGGSSTHHRPHTSSTVAAVAGSLGMTKEQLGILLGLGAAAIALGVVLTVVL